MLHAGLTGGYATGKTFVASELEKRGCRLIYADALGHEALAPSGAAYGAVAARYGEAILDNTGVIDRKRLGSLVFADPLELEWLSGVIHPAVRRREEEILAGIEDPRAIVVTEAAILIETGRYREFQKVILTTCSPEEQIVRGVHRDSITREQAETRIARQLPFEKKKEFADYVIETSGTKRETVRQVEAVFAELKQLAG